MRNFQSTTKGIWQEILPITLTEKEETFLSSKNPETIENGKEILDGINSRKYQTVIGEMLDKLINFYDGFEAHLERQKITNYKLISCDLDETFKGIINYRVDNEHKQIRL